MLITSAQKNENTISASTTTVRNRFTTTGTLSSTSLDGSQHNIATFISAHSYVVASTKPPIVGNQISIKTGQKNENTITAFFTKPIGITLASLGTIALLTTGGCLARRLISSASGTINLVCNCFRSYTL